MSDLTVGEVMTRDVFAVAPDTSLVTAARLLSNRHVSGAPVIDALGKVVGVITQMDLVDPDRERSDRLGTSVFYYRVHDRLQVVHGESPVTAVGVVADVMSPFVLSVPASSRLVDAARLMVHDDIHRLLVLENGKLVGIVSATDVMRAMVAGART